MVGQSKNEGIGVRFEPYILELREFFSSRGVTYGSPADVVAFAERVNAPGPFQDEMGSLVRSILFQEGESLGRGELLALVAVAVGGPEIETAAQEMHSSVRQMFVFINAALRQRERMFAGGPEDDQVTAGDVLAAAEAARQVEGHTVGGWTPENGHPRRTAETPHAEHERAEERNAPTGSGMLFRAVSMSGGEEPGTELSSGESVWRRWMVPAIVAAAVVLGAGAYFAKSTMTHSGTRTAGTDGNTLTQAGSSAGAGSCVGSMAPGISRSSLEERSRWAHRLLEQKLYDAALPELKSVAQTDPGYPGINLDESDALLRLKRPDDAREAVDTQIGISECLAKLPGAALDSYCNAEFSPAASGACRPELARIRQAAQLQAAMVHLELGHRIAPDGVTDSAVTDVPRTGPHEGATVAHTRTAEALEPSVIRPRHTEPLPPATEGDSARPVAPRSLTVARSPAAAKSPVATKPGRKAEGDDSLIHGEGTDSSLGAYSKPQ